MYRSLNKFAENKYYDVDCVTISYTWRLTKLFFKTREYFSLYILLGIFKKFFFFSRIIMRFRYRCIYVNVVVTRKRTYRYFMLFF